MYNFCTFFDSNYITRGLALYNSLCNHVIDFELYVLCLDFYTYDLLDKISYKNIKLIRLKDIEEYFPALLDAKKNRTTIEYYFTCSPFLPLYVMQNYASVSMVTYLDADFYFFSNPDKIFEVFRNESILMTEHNFPDGLKHLSRFGKYNVGFLIFRNNKIGRKCLEDWGNQCIQWCYDKAENGKYADQKYLEDWPINYKEVMILKNPGVELSPWNISNYNLSVRNSHLLVNSNELIFFHFHDFKMITFFLFSTKLNDYHHELTELILNMIYIPYIKELKSITKNLPKQKIKSIRYTTNWRRNIKEIIHAMLNRDLIVNFGSTDRFIVL